MPTKKHYNVSLQEKRWIEGCRGRMMLVGQSWSELVGQEGNRFLAHF